MIFVLKKNALLQDKVLRVKKEMLLVLWYERVCLPMFIRFSL